MAQLQALGTQLVGLSPAQLQAIPLSDTLRAAVADAQRFTQRGAHRRQLQYIGRLMRTESLAPLREALASQSGARAAQTEHFHYLEVLRSRFLSDEAVLDEILACACAQERGSLAQMLRQLRRNALLEAVQQKPPRCARALFRQLRTLIPDPERPHQNLEDNAP
jgi:ribosome-associated protein